MSTQSVVIQVPDMKAIELSEVGNTFFIRGQIRQKCGCGFTCGNITVLTVTTEKPYGNFTFNIPCALNPECYKRVVGVIEKNIALLKA